MGSTEDYKWRKRICHKWQEELQQQDQQRQQHLQLQEHKQQQQQQQQQQQHLRLHHQQLQQRHQQQQKHASQVEQQLAQQSLMCRRFSNFVDDPLNLRKLFLSRRTLKMLTQLPNFECLVKACFVRVRFGVGHRVAQIMGFSKWRPSSEPPLILRIDSNPRVFCLDQLSNSYFDAAELLHWKHVWQVNNFELPSRSFVEKKYKTISEAKQSVLGQPQHANSYITHKLAQERKSLVHGYPTTQQLHQQLHGSQRNICNMLPQRIEGATISHATPTGIYLVKPFERYKPYPATAEFKSAVNCQIPTAPIPVASKQMDLKRQPNSECSKKKISLDEYRKRIAMKNK
ncbi:GH24279 [Drosophila grimshawi]|uniref:GH24279 n=1 Tax=Drosophila grimshawi TaxID=7222 RepID=B4JMS0_DROGR|nr:GH24279 [Drosophila grimshawi]